MTKIQKRARLHEKSVQAVARGDVRPSQRQTGRRSSTTQSAISKITYPEEVMTTAKKLSNGDPGRILILHKGGVVVMNYPGQFKRGDFASKDQ